MNECGENVECRCLLHVATWTARKSLAARGWIELQDVWMSPDRQASVTHAAVHYMSRATFDRELDCFRRIGVDVGDELPKTRRAT
jgi:hypothetical protein